MYGEIYFHNYCIDRTGENAVLSIRKRGYSGVSTEVNAGKIPFTKTLLNSGEDRVGGVYPTMATIQLIGSPSFGMDDLYTADDSEFQVVHTINGQVDWIGFLVPENFSEADHDGYRILDLKAFDGLTKLKDLKFVAPSGQNYGVSDGVFERSFIYVISEALKKTGLDLDILTLVDRSAVQKTNTFETVLSTVFVNTGWIYSTLLIPPYGDGRIYEGVYARYKHQDIADGDEGGGWYVSKVVEVDDSEIGNGGGLGVRLEPKFTYTGAYDFEFFTPVPSINDVLASATHDTRNWIDPSVTIQSDKDVLPNPYYYYTDGTYDTWYVLDSLARLFDAKLTQNKGKWVFESLDKQYVSTDYYRYNKDGVFVDRQPRPSEKILDCYSDTDVRLAGNVRFIDKTLKRATVNYPYRYKVEGDPLRDLLTNGTFFLPIKPIGGDANPSTFTPDFWKREVVSNPITLNLIREDYPGGIGWNSILFSTPTEFNSFNRLQPEDPLRVVKGDKLTLTWKQSVYNVRTLIGGLISSQRSYVTMVIHLLTKDNKNYYLVNSGDQPGWTNTMVTSPNPKGQWLREESGKVWHFLSNYSSNFGEATYEGTWSEFSEINLVLDNIPEDGTLFISFVGGSWRQGGYSENSKSRAANSYIPEINLNIDGEVVYSPMQVDTPRFQSFYRMDTHQMNPSLNRYALVKIAEVGVTKVVDYGSGRVAQYINDGNYYDSLTIEVPLGDEDNDDHLSVIKVGGQVNSLWTDRGGSLGVGTIGMLLAKTLLRRYLLPSFGLDGGLLSENLQMLDMLDLYDDGRLFGIRNGDISAKDSIFNGTLEEYKLNPAPENGFDGGANSLRKGSGSGSSGGGGGSTGGSLPPVTAPQSLQSVTEVGNTTTLDISARGLRVSDFLVVPNNAPDEDDIVSGESYLWLGDGATSDVPSTGTLAGLSDVSITSPTNGQSLVWNATTLKWENATVDAGGGEWGSITGVLSNQTDLQNALNAKASVVHTHSASDIISGVLNIDRIPTGTTGTTVALGNHTHSFAQITNKPTTLSGYGITDAYTKSEVNGLIPVYYGANGIHIQGTNISPVYGTTAGSVAEGNDRRIIEGETAYSWGNHSDVGYAISGTGGAQVRNNSQLDARYMQVTAPANAITTGDITNWNTAYSQRHTHANKALLDVINQSLATTSSVQFAQAHILDSLRIPTVAPVTPLNGNLWLGDGATAGVPDAGTLVGLSDVNITSPTNGQALVWNSATSKWVNGNVASGGGTWGSITGVLSNQTDLQTALNGKANLVHTHPWAQITNKPTTLAGYGITDAYTKEEADALIPTFFGAVGIQVNGNNITPVYGTTAGSIAEGNDIRIIEGEIAYSWGNHSDVGYAVSGVGNSQVRTNSQLDARYLQIGATSFGGNSATATVLQTARTIGLSGVTATAQSFNGSANITIPITAVPANIVTGTLSNNTTGSAATLTTARSIAMTGDVAWSVTFNGSANVTAAGTIANGAVTNAKMANMGANTFKGRLSTAGAPQDLTVAQMQSALNIPSSAKQTAWDGAVALQHSHSNKAFLDTINQNMGTSNTVTFDGIIATTRLRIPTSAPSSPVNGEIWIDTAS